MASARENDLNPDVRIGLKLPFTRDRAGLFGTTENTLEQSGHNIKNLLLTAKGERVMQPDFGSNLRTLLFEQYTEDLTDRIKEEIQEAMSTWLPYIVISSVSIIEDETNPNQTKVDLDFSLNYEPNRFDSITLNFDNTTETTSAMNSGY
jgi:phage baseplate assembly protein W